MISLYINVQFLEQYYQLVLFNIIIQALNVQ